MKNPVIERVVQKLITSGLAASSEIDGCQAFEIANVEAHFDIRFPVLYKAFLSEMGRSAGKFYQGTDMFCSSLLELRDYAKELLSEDKSPFTLPQDAFVFMVHQGYQFMYFHTKGVGDDPPVYSYLEGDKMPQKAYDSFTAFLEQSVAEHIAQLPGRG